MRDKVLTRAIIISVAVHLVAVSFIGRTSSTRLSAASIVQTPQRLLNVDLVKDPFAKPDPVAAPPPSHGAIPASRPVPGAGVTPSALSSVHSATPQPSSPGRARVASNPGGALNMGTPDRNGDLAGVDSGRTPSGWVPGGDSGRGIGSGSEAGAGTPEPPRADPPRHVEPAPEPPPPPAPKRVTVRVCDDSGLLPGEHCKGTHSAAFNEGDEPARICGRCKAPEPVHNSRIADRKDPVLLHDPKMRIPDSVEEGLSVSVEIDFYVDTDGSVSDARVSRSSGNRDLDRSAIARVSKRRYEPAVQNGVAQRVKVSCVIPFRT